MDTARLQSDIESEPSTPKVAIGQRKRYKTKTKSCNLSNSTSPYQLKWPDEESFSHLIEPPTSSGIMAYYFSHFHLYSCITNLINFNLIGEILGLEKNSTSDSESIPGPSSEIIQFYPDPDDLSSAVQVEIQNWDTSQPPAKVNSSLPLITE